MVSFDAKRTRLAAFSGGGGRPASNAAEVEPGGDLLNIEAEQALLAAVLIRNDVLLEADALVSADDFYEPVHARIWTEARKLILGGRAANPTTLRALFAKDVALKDLGGPDYFKTLVRAAVTVINGADYAGVIRALAVRRRLVAAARSIMTAAHA